MTRLLYKSSMMKNYTLVDLNNAINYLSTSINNTNELSIPSDFVDIQYLKNLPDYLNDNLERLNKLSNWLKDNDNEYKKVSNELEKSINKIDDVVIKKRIGYIK